MSAAVVILEPYVPDRESAVAELRREALSALVRQQQVRDQLAPIRTQACEIERRAARALARGDELLGRQILARGMFTLKAREALEAALVEARGHVCHLLTTMVRAENQIMRGDGK